MSQFDRWCFGYVLRLRILCANVSAIRLQWSTHQAMRAEEHFFIRLYYLFDEIFGDRELWSAKCRFVCIDFEFTHRALAAENT